MSRLSFSSFMEGTFNANPALAGLDPATRAQQLGLQSDGSGGYIDSATGQKVAATVNNELVFYDAQGGATADSEGGSDQQNINPQPTWRHPSGFAMTPPHRAENQKEVNAIPDPIPAAPPPGYNQYVDQTIEKYNRDQQKIPIEISSQHRRAAGEAQAKEFEKFNPGANPSSIPDTINNPSSYQDLMYGMRTPANEEFSYFEESDQALNILKKMKAAYDQKRAAQRAEEGRPPAPPMRRMSGGRGGLPANTDGPPKQFIFQKEDIDLQEANPMGMRTRYDRPDMASRDPEYGKRATGLARVDTSPQEFMRGVRGQERSSRQYERDVEGASDIQGRMAASVNRNPELQQMADVADRGAVPIERAARQRQLRRDVEDVESRLGYGQKTSYGSDKERKADLIDRMHNVVTNERLKGQMGGPSFNGEPLESAAGRLAHLFPSDLVDYEEDQNGNPIVTKNTVDDITDILRDPNSAEGALQRRGTLDLAASGNANTWKNFNLRDLATFVPEIFEKNPKLREYLGMDNEEFNRSKKLSDMMRLVQDTSRDEFKYSDLQALNSVMKPGQVDDETLDYFMSQVPNMDKSKGGIRNLYAAGAGSDVGKKIRMPDGTDLADDDGNPYLLARDHRLWTGMDEYMNSYEEDDKEDMMGLLDKYSQIYDKDGKSVYDLRNDEWEPGVKVGGQTNMAQLSNDISLLKNSLDTVGKNTPEGQAIKAKIDQLDKFKGMSNQNRNRAMAKIFLQQMGADPYSASGGLMGSLTETDLEHIRSLGSGGFDHPDNWVWANRHINQMRGNQPTGARMLKNILDNHGGDVKGYLEKEGGRVRQAIMKKNLESKFNDAAGEEGVDMESLMAQKDEALAKIGQYGKLNLPPEIGQLGKLSLADLDPTMQQKVMNTTTGDIRSKPEMSPEEVAAQIRNTATSNNVAGLERTPGSRTKRTVPPEMLQSILQSFGIQ